MKTNLNTVANIGIALSLLAYVTWREQVVREEICSKLIDFINHQTRSDKELHDILRKYMILDTKHECRQERINLVVLTSLRDLTGGPVDEEIETLIYERVKAISESEEKIAKFEEEKLKNEEN